MTTLSPTETEWAQANIAKLLDALNARILGQEALIEAIVVACLAKGNVLLEGLPGLGKTRLVKGLAGLLGLEFRRIGLHPICSQVTSQVPECCKRWMANENSLLCRPHLWKSDSR